MPPQTLELDSATPLNKLNFGTDSQRAHLFLNEDRFLGPAPIRNVLHISIFTMYLLLLRPGSAWCEKRMDDHTTEFTQRHQITFNVCLLIYSPHSPSFLVPACENTCCPIYMWTHSTLYSPTYRYTKFLDWNKRRDDGGLPLLVISRSDISIRETETCWSARRPRRRWWNKMGSAVAATTRIYSPSSCVVIVGLNWALGNSRLPATGIEEQERASVRHWLVVAGQGY